MEPDSKRTKQEAADLVVDESRYIQGPLTHVDLYELFKALCRDTAPDNRVKRLEELLTLFRYTYFRTRLQDEEGVGVLYLTQEASDAFLESDRVDKATGIVPRDVKAYRQARDLWNLLRDPATPARMSVRQELATLSSILCSIIDRRLRQLASELGLSLDTIPVDPLREIVKQLPLAAQLVMRKLNKKIMTAVSNPARAALQFYQPFVQSLWILGLYQGPELETLIRQNPVYKSLFFYAACLFTTDLARWFRGMYQSRIPSEFNTPLPHPPVPVLIYNRYRFREDVETFQKALKSNDGKVDYNVPMPLFLYLWNQYRPPNHTRFQLTQFWLQGANGAASPQVLPPSGGPFESVAMPRNYLTPLLDPSAVAAFVEASSPIGTLPPAMLYSMQRMTNECRVLSDAVGPPGPYIQVSLEDIPAFAPCARWGFDPTGNRRAVSASTLPMACRFRSWFTVVRIVSSMIDVTSPIFPLLMTSLIPEYSGGQVAVKGNTDAAWRAISVVRTHNYFAERIGANPIRVVLVLGSQRIILGWHSYPKLILADLIIGMLILVQRVGFHDMWKMEVRLYDARLLV